MNQANEANIIAKNNPKPWRRWWFWLLIIVGLLSLILAIVFYQVWQALYLPLVDSDRPILVTIETSQSISEVIDQLEQKGLIASAFWLKTIARLNKFDVKSGTYYFSSLDNALTILDQLASGKISERQVTIPEGWRAEQIAERLEANRLIQNKTQFYEKLIDNTNLDELRARFELPNDASLEGLLFPDTYRFATDQDADKIIQKMLDNFENRTADLDLTYQEIILASIVEREAKFDEDRAKIAGVYTNRLQAQMHLEADPTVQYAKANQLYPNCLAIIITHAEDCNELEWWPTISITDYQTIDSAFNTYLIKALPSHPIANPGLKSLQAATNPTKHNYYYFVTDRDGHAHFAKTLAEHNQNKHKYLNQ